MTEKIKTVFSVVLLATIFGEFFVPFVLRHFYAGYDARRMVMSALGSPESPVRRWYNAWLLWLGMVLCVAAFFVWNDMRNASPVIASLSLFVILVFAIGAGILSGIFSVNESKQTVSLASKIHGIGAAIGFMALVFFPLLYALWQFRLQNAARGIVSAVAFVLALAFFVCFVLGDKERFSNTAPSYEGLWERLTLAAMYVPFVLRVAENL